MQKERLAEYLERYHLGASNAATSRELELTFGIKGIQVRHMVNALRRDVYKRQLPMRRGCFIPNWNLRKMRLWAR